MRKIKIPRKIKKWWSRVKPQKHWPRWRQAVQWGIIGIGGAFVLGIFMIAILSIGLPSIKKGSDLLQAQSTLILDREGNIMYAVHGEENREIIPIEQISPSLINATIAIEDDQFMEHNGFDLPCLFKAAAHEFFGVGIRRGCSTITQQLVKNIFLTPEQTYTRKIRELILAVRVDFKFEKDEILELYLNEIPYGNNAYGAELAATRYFGKPAAELTLTESAILAALPQAPTRYSPYGNNLYSHLIVEFTPEQLANNPIKSEADLDYEDYVRGLIGATIELSDGSSVYIKGRTDIVLDAMRDQGFITADEAEVALKESWTMEFQTYRDSITAPHFVLYVKELLEEKYGKEVIEQGGLKVYTTLDPILQTYAEEAVSNYYESNTERFNASNASLVSLQPQTGQVLAMVGSADYWNEEIDGNVNIATRYLQPGSSFKPFVYALSFLNGFGPGSVMYDVRTQFGANDWPNNYDGQFWGPMSIRTALGKSRNIPAIKAYFLAGGEEEIIPFMENFGISLDSSLGYGWPLALGTGEVRLLDLVNAYAAFANTGTQVPMTPILKIENSQGEILEQWEETKGKETVDPQVAYLINNILSDTSAGLGPRLTIPGNVVAAKTGTSNKKNENDVNVPNNAWTVGYSTKLVTGVWAGNADGTAMYGTANGYDVAAPIWNAYMTNALKELPSESFPRPEGIVDVQVSKDTGLIPTESTKNIVTEKYASFNKPTQLDNSYQTLKIDGHTGMIANDYSPEWSLKEQTFLIHKAIVPDYPTWQAGIDNWVRQSENMDLPPSEIDNVHTAETYAKRPSIIITSPTAFSSVSRGVVPVEVEVSAGNGADKVEFYLDEILRYIESHFPYSGSVKIPINATPGQTFEIETFIYDDLGYRSSSSVEVIFRENLDEGPADEVEDEEENPEDEEPNDSSSGNGNENNENDNRPGLGDFLNNPFQERRLRIRL